MATLSQQAQQVAKSYVKKIRSRIAVRQALLFGSAARDTMHKDSDIDLIVLSDDFKQMDLTERLMMLSRLRGREFISWPMDILGYTPEEFEKLASISSMFAEAKRQGIIVS